VEEPPASSFDAAICRLIEHNPSHDFEPPPDDPALLEHAIGEETSEQLEIAPMSPMRGCATHLNGCRKPPQ
jgi:hypothetical protein